MFVARISDQNPAAPAIMMENARAGAAIKQSGIAFDAVRRHPTGRVRVSLVEDGVEAFFAFGDTTDEAVKQAIAMQRKAARGGGR